MSEHHVVPQMAGAIAEIRQYGSTVLRGAWKLEHLNRIRAAIVEFNEIRGRRIAEGLVAPTDRMLHTHGAGLFPNLMANNLLDGTFLQEMFAGTPYHRLCAEYFEDDALYVAPSRLAFRMHDPRKSDRSFVPFHQDSGSQDPRVRSILNCWIPLDPGCGVEAPGLEVVRTPSEPNFPLKDFGLATENAVYDFITIDRARIVEAHGEQFMAPSFDLGDGFVFSQDVIHRTYVTAEMTQPRMNFEFRVFSLKHLAPGASADEVRRTALRVA